MKKCKKCNNEFEPRGNKGSEQIYCSQDCRQKAGIERYKQRLINSNNNQYECQTNETNYQGTTNRNQTFENSTNNTNNLRVDERVFRSMENELPGYSGRMGEFNPNGTGRITQPYNKFNGYYNEQEEYNFREFIGLIRENANLRAEVKLLTEKVTNLEAELMDYELEEDMEEEEQPGFLGGIMNAYKQDPTTTVLFAKDMVLEFLKPKEQPKPNPQKPQ